MDLAVDKEYGDLWPTSRKVRDGLRKGIFAARLAGSPCNTYSEARNHQPKDTTKSWPRPVRTAEAAWGIQYLTTKELRHVRMGTTFALEVMWVFAMIYRTGGTFLSEHPWIPEEESRVSVWRLPIFRLLEQLPEMRLHCVPQGLFGAKAWKRTGIAALRCPRLVHSMRSWKTTYTPPSEEYIGVDSNGSFRTAVLKEYPVQFSGGLAQAIYDQLDRNSRSCREVEAPDLDLWLGAANAALETIRAEAVMRPDLN